MVVAMSAPKSKFPYKGKDSRKKKQREQNEDTQNSQTKYFDPEVEDLEPDRNGKFSVCFQKERALDRDEEEIRDEFNVCGNVADVHISRTMVFVRFLSKEELQNCLRKFKSTYLLRIARPKGSEEATGKAKLTNREEMGKANTEGGKAPDKRNNYKGNGVEDGNRKFLRNKESSPRGDLENSEEMSSGIELFASNIESEVEFRKSIEKYKPKFINVIEDGIKRYAFVLMSNMESATACVEDLNRSMQITRNLFIKFNDKIKHNSHSFSDHNSSRSNSHSDESLTSSKLRQHNLITKNETTQNIDLGLNLNGMPDLESDYSDMPPLVKDSDVCNTDGQYDYDCRVLVTHFPPDTRESELRGVFKDYRILDICVRNNGYANGCTIAEIYMSTLYEAMRAIMDTGGFFLHGHHMKVLPPPDNVLLKKILLRVETGLREY